MGLIRLWIGIDLPTLRHCLIEHKGNGLRGGVVKGEGALPNSYMGTNSLVPDNLGLSPKRGLWRIHRADAMIPVDMLLEALWAGNRLVDVALLIHVKFINRGYTRRRLLAVEWSRTYTTHENERNQNKPAVHAAILSALKGKSKNFYGFGIYQHEFVC